MMVDCHTNEIFKDAVFFDIRPAVRAVIYTVIFIGEEPSVGEEMLLGS